MKTVKPWPAWLAWPFVIVWNLLIAGAFIGVCWQASQL